MQALVELLGPALALTVVLVAIHTLFGLQVLQRKVVFIDLAIAQMAALGATVAFILGHAPLSASSYGYSFGFTLIAALLLSGLRFLPQLIPHEALIGILYVVAAAATLLFVDGAPQGAEHIKQMLTGNIITVGYDEVARLLPLYAGVAAVLGLIAWRGGAARAGWWGDLIFYAGFGAVVTSSVAVAGVLPVFAFLIMPACVGIWLADTALRQWLVGLVFGSIAGALGLLLSYRADLPAGAAVVCSSGALLAIIGMARIGASAWRNTGHRSRYLTHGATALACLLALSALGVLALPRVDQPLLDALEHVLPSTRSLYQSEGEQILVAESLAYAERYKLEGERMNLMESESRSSGKLSDEKIVRIASMIKSYNEMRKGEQFVVRETVARARERSRVRLFVMHVGMALLLLLPLLYRRSRSAQMTRRPPQ